MTTKFKTNHYDGNKLFAMARENCAFFLEFMKHPGKVGSICPSGTALAEELLNGMSPDDQGLIIDLGAGSGPVTEHMLQSGIRAERIIAIEALDDFAESFFRRCPGIPLLIGDAGDLKAILDRVAPGRQVSAIISSLPFRAMSPDVTQRILTEIHAVLRERGGKLVQYSYAWWLQYPLKGNGFAPMAAKTVWNNIPPARVETYQAAFARSYEKTVPSGWRKWIHHFSGYAHGARASVTELFCKTMQNKNWRSS